MKTSRKWFDGAKTVEQKKEVQAKLLSALPAFEILEKIILKEKASNKVFKNSKIRYTLPCWDKFQADAVGEERAYDSILKLIKIKLEEEGK